MEGNPRYTFPYLLEPERALLILLRPSFYSALRYLNTVKSRIASSFFEGLHSHDAAGDMWVDPVHRPWRHAAHLIDCRIGRCVVGRVEYSVGTDVGIKFGPPRLAHHPEVHFLIPLGSLRHCSECVLHSQLAW